MFVVVLVFVSPTDLYAGEEKKQRGADHQGRNHKKRCGILNVFPILSVFRQYDIGIERITENPSHPQFRCHISGCDAGCQRSGGSLRATTC